MPSPFTAVSYAQTIAPQELSALRSVFDGLGLTIRSEEPRSYPGFDTVTFELLAPHGNESDAVASLRAVLANAGQAGLETAVVLHSLRNATRKLLIMDVDSTLIQQEVIELLAAHAGTEEKVAKVTEAAMRGDMDFAESLHQRVATLEGLSEAVLPDVVAKVEFSVGAQRLVAHAKRAGHIVAAVSGGFSQILNPLAEHLGLDYSRANDLEIIDGRLTGRVIGAVVDKASKAECLRRWSAESGIPLEATMAIGDGANDLDMLDVAALGVAFNAKPAVRALADAQINLPNLDVALVLAGI